MQDAGHDVAEEQAEAVAALASGAATGDDAPLRRIDTHMSHVFLAPQRVYKLKRARRHPFADFTSAEARRRACLEELEVNQALAGDLYLAVEPLVRAAESVRLGGEGEPLEHLVVMRRFADGALFSERAAAGRLTEAEAAEAAEAIAGFHAAQPPRLDRGHAADYRRIVEGLRRTEASGAAELGLASAGEDLYAALEQEAARLTPQIEARRRAGRVRRGHGDLHLRNLCLHEGRVLPFDALEFDPELATADVLHDLAFLLMDLKAHGLDSHARAAWRRYRAVAGEPAGAVRLMGLFMGLRAAVRMAVAVEAADLEGAARYRRLGAALLEDPGLA